MKKTLPLFWMITFIAFQALPQENNRDSWHVGLGAGANLLYGTQEGNSNGFDVAFAPLFTFQYFKQFSTFFDLKASVGYQAGSDWTGLNMADNSGQISNDVRGNGMMHFEVLPILYTNPDRLGYIPSKIKFYFGIGLGWVRTGFIERTQLALSENEKVLVEYGLKDPLNIDKNRLSSFYVPIKFGLRHDLKQGWILSSELGLGILFTGEYPGQQLSVPAWSQWQVSIGRKFSN